MLSTSLAPKVARHSTTSIGPDGSCSKTNTVYPWLMELLKQQLGNEW